MIRPAEVVLPVLREALPEVSVVTWMADVQQRTLPMILVRPLGGYRHDRRPKDLTLRVIEMSAHTASDLADTEQLYDSVGTANRRCRQRLGAFHHRNDGANSTIPTV